MEENIMFRLGTCDWKITKLEIPFEEAMASDRPKEEVIKSDTGALIEVANYIHNNMSPRQFRFFSDIISEQATIDSLGD